MATHLRAIGAHELAGVNAHYAAIDFVPCGVHDLVVLAEVDGQWAGLGRLVPVGPEVAELGGMHVFPAFQGRGLTKRLIAFLIAQSRHRTLYCLPFAELEALYRAAGFHRLDPADAVPRQISDKLAWCKRFYPKPVLLLKRERDD